MRLRMICTIFAAMLLTPAAWSQATALKFGVINVQAAVQSTGEGKQAGAELQSQFAPRQTELQNMQKQIEDLQRKMNEGARTLSDEEKAKMQREGELLSRRGNPRPEPD